MTGSPPPGLWAATADEDWSQRPALAGDADVDVAIIGGGLTGLWAARALAMGAPDLRVIVVESQTCGFGASGRNGGWASVLFPSEPAWAHEPMVEALASLEAALAEDDIDAQLAHGGTFTFVTSPAQEERVRAVATEPGYRWMDRSEVREHVRPEPVFGAAFTPHCAALHPARLVRGLARSVEARGVRIVEGTRVESFGPRSVTTDHGLIRADQVLRCTEGFTAELPDLRRAVLPIYSLMIATEPLSADVWDEIGLSSRATFTDGRHLIIYGQRTADGRIAFGGRGAPYHFGSRVRPGFDRDDGVFRDLERTLRSLFPQIGRARITHRWGGPLGIARDWNASVGLDRGTGLGWAGGYVGDGVTTAHLAGLTLADLVLGLDTHRTRLAWVDHRSRDWEPEPFRWVGVNVGRAMAAGADRSEVRTGRRARFTERLMDGLTGG